MLAAAMVTLTLLGLAGGVLLLLTCNGDSDPELPAEKDPLILRVADLEVRHSEILAFEDYLAQLDPTTGEMKRCRDLLSIYLLPLKLAQRDFRNKRADQRKRAEVLSGVLGNSASHDELIEQTRRYPGAHMEHGVVRRVMTLPEARWAFEDSHIGQASPILETPRGYTILATLDKQPGPTRHYEAADVWVVPFHTHDHRSFVDWLAKAKSSLSGKLTFIHDDYKEAIPYWLRQ
jgi:hypothetical protein